MILIQEAIQQINFTGNLDQRGNTIVFFITEEVKETILHFSQGTVRALQLSKLKSGIKNGTEIILNI